MIGKIIGAIAGQKAAKHVSGIGGTGAAVMGVAATTLLRRLGPVGLIAAAAGTYAVKKYADRRKEVGSPGKSRLQNATVTQA